ncbi:MAG: bifunctional sulfate adenylyltransferase/adenylylsulfate kinase [candidate division Zixibacteria bacterium]|nr:bifunctional sulfate adenylyltransferase/adenylylsulfate kinase [candidate division Zixibacteria bacterium]
MPTSSPPITLISPCGGYLTDLMVPEERREAEKVYVGGLPSVQLSERAVCDLEMLATGGFSPLTGFMGEADYHAVLETMRLVSGHLFPVPVTLPVESPAGIRLHSDLALRNTQNELLAVMTVEEIYPWDPAELAYRVCGTTDERHPFVAELRRWGRYNLAGRLRVLQLPAHHDFPALRLTPAATRERLASLGRGNVVAFQTRHPLHRAHEEMMRRAIQETEGTLLLHPAVGMTEPGAVDPYTRIRAYNTLTRRYFEPGKVLLALLPLAMRLSGPREALWDALIRRNYGANFIVTGRDHGTPGSEENGPKFYEPYAAQSLLDRYAAEIGVIIIPFRELVYLPDEERYEEITNIPKDARFFSLSGAHLRERYLNTGTTIPAWFVRPEAADILEETYPPRSRQGFCIWFTGLSGSGKSTTASVLTVRLQAYGRQVTVLDGDVVRTHLSKKLGFSREDRDTNIRRIGFVASEIVRHGGATVCAAVSPYRATRDEVRAMIDPDRFVEVFVDTPLYVCEKRDVKGMYAKARRGEIAGFTGIDDPYEPPLHPEIHLDTVGCTAEENAERIVAYLTEKGFLKPA